MSPQSITCASTLQRNRSNLKLGEKPLHGARGNSSGSIVSKRGIEVDCAKVELIENLPPPTSVKQIRSFLGHADFYCRFIKDFSKISRPLCNLLAKDTTFHFDDACLEAFHKLRSMLSSAPIMKPPDWSLPF
jgi:hypothetical protein